MTGKTGYKIERFIGNGGSVDEQTSGFDTEQWVAECTRILHAHHNVLYKEHKLMRYIHELSVLARHILTENNKLRILDIGGGIGQIAADYISLIPQEKWGLITYHIVDSDINNKIFKSLASIENLEFTGFRAKNPLYHTDSALFNRLDDVNGNTYDIIICNSVIHYIKDVEAFLKNVSMIDFNFLFIGRTCCSPHAPFGCIQDIGEAGKVAMWVVNKDRILSTLANCGFRMVLEYVVAETMDYPEDWPEECRDVTEHCFLFARTSARISPDAPARDVFSPPKS